MCYSGGMTDLRAILKHTIKDTETGQTFAGFASKSAAETYVEYLSAKTGRTYEIGKS